MATLRFTTLPPAHVAPRWQPPHQTAAPPAAPRPLVTRLRQLWRRRHTRGLLATFDDRMLKDIGLTRTEAEHEANKPFWRT